MDSKIFNSKKIAIFGWPATGKSTFGEMLSIKLGIELYSLDIIRWKYSRDGVKDDSLFLRDYNEILQKEEWIIEGNALDFIDSRLEQSDLLIFFDSTVDECISNYLNREKKVSLNKEEWKKFDISKSPSLETSINWIKNRYAKKIEKLRPILDNYKDKLIVIKNYDELNALEELINGNYTK